MSTDQVFDCLIIGGGPAGLSTALGLSRILHTAVLFDSGVYRNRNSSHMHTVSTWDHKNPAEYRAAARKELTEGRYSSVQIKDVAVAKVEKLGDGFFKATDATGAEWMGKKLVLATGSKDEYLDIPGYGACWATGIYHCLFCHGFEDKDALNAGVLAVGDCAKPTVATHLAYQAQQFAKEITIYTHGSDALAAELAPLVAAHSARTTRTIKIEPRRIQQLAKVDGPTASGKVTLAFEDGHRETEGFLVHKANTAVNGPFAQQLGLELTTTGDIKVAQPIPETSVSGCFAAGDCATVMKAVAIAVSAGMAAAAGVSLQLLG
ncbi:hypothetical protein FGG08_007380 [Glutinoglossum americanum]|uniref:FAD/NAD(P)-binding domain-containing protein n=1 Tax=Glutinoglossum americanum TaxID=1670608 RepID=A0A9P8HWF7_9PEZI|nr:hypothetical protein FGG08_007380 [Glutinoglossum americanum]